MVQPLSLSFPQLSLGPPAAASRGLDRIMMTPEEEQSLVREAGGAALSGIAAVGNLLGLPISMALDAAVGENPLDQLLTPFSDVNRTYGRDFLRKIGAVTGPDTYGNFLGGMAAEIALDPLTYMTLGMSAVGKAGRVMQKAGAMPDLMAFAAKKNIGKREARMTATLQDILDASPTKTRIETALKKAAVNEGTTLDAIKNQPIGGLFGIGLPGQQPRKLFGTGERALEYAKKADFLGEKIRYSPPVRHAASIFNYGLRGATSTFMQKKAPITTIAETREVARAREIIAPMVDDLHESGVFDPNKKVLHTSFMDPVGEMRPQGMEGVMNNSNAIFNFMEEAGKNWMNLPPELEKFKPHFNTIKNEFPKMLEDFEFAGLKRSALHDMMVRYNPRVRHVFPVGTRGVRPTRIIDPKDPHATQRNPVLVDWAGGTAFLNKLSVDPMVSGKRWNMGYVDKVPDNVLDAKARYVLTQYPEEVLGGSAQQDILKLTQGALDPKRTEELIKRVRPLTDLMMHLDPQHSATKIPLFRVDPTEAWLSRMEHGYRSIAAANHITDTLAEIIKTQPAVVPGDASVGVALRELGVGGDMADDVIKEKLKGRKDVMEALGVDEITDEMFEEQLFVPPDVLKDMSRYMASFTKPEEVKGILRAVDMFTNMFKTSVTSLFPGFHVRNFYSGALFQNFVIGSRDPRLAAWNPMSYLRPIMDAHDLSANPSKALDLTDMPEFADMDPMEATRVFREEAFSNRVVGRHFGMAGNVIGVETADLLSEMPGARPVFSPPPAGTTARQRATNVWETAGVGSREDVWTPSRVGRDVARYTENLNRLSGYIGLRRQGYSPEAAARKVKAAHVAYDELTKTERGVFRRLIPFYSFCVPEDCEILTQEGWKFYQDLRGDEQVLSMDPHTGEADWSKIEAVNVFEYDGMLMTMSNEKDHYSFTPDHSWPVIDAKNPSDRKMVKGYDLRQSHKIPRAADFYTPPDEAPRVTPRELAILAWVFTDGYIRKRGNHWEMMIYQSPNKFLKEVVSLVGPDGSQGTPHPDSGVVCVHITGETRKRLAQIATSPKELLSYATRVEHAHLVAMYDAMVMAEGSSCGAYHKFGKKNHFAQEKQDVLDLFQIVCVLLGKVAHQSKRGAYVSHQNKCTKVCANTLGTEWHKGKVWCPTTKHGTWMMRRNGRIIWTGNTKGMMPWTIEELIHRPGGKLAIGIKSATRARGEEEVTPDYIGQTISMPLGRLPDGSDRYFTGIGLMFEDPLSYATFLTGDVKGTLLEIGSRLNPGIKGLAEWATGQTFFQRGPLGGRPIEDLDPTLGRIAANLVGQEEAFDTPMSLEHIVANSPLTRLTTTLRTLTDKRKGPLAKAANTLTGLRISDVSPAAQDAILRERAAPLMKKLGARTFRKVYFNEDELAELDPVRRQQALKLHALMSQLADRAKARKEEREKLLAR